MAMLQIKCPKTGKPVDTGVDVAASAYKWVQMSENAVGCPHCGKVHTWGKSDVINPPA